MGRHIFNGQVQADAAAQSGDLVTLAQRDAGDASAKNRANHTGTQTASTISDFTTSVNTLIQNVVGAAPAALDTLVELAAALGNDANFSTTITNTITALTGRVSALESPAAAAYKTTIGDGSATTFTVTHSLATLDVFVEAVQISNGQTVWPVPTRPSANTVGLDFGSTAPAASSIRVLIRKAV